MHKPSVSLILIIFLSFPCSQVYAEKGLSLTQVIEVLAGQGYRIIYSSEVERQAGILKLADISLDSLRQSLNRRGLELRKVNDIWVIAYLESPATYTVTGRLIAETGEPVEGGRVKRRNARNTAFSNPDGLFALDGVPLRSVLEVRAKGFSREFVTVDASHLGDIPLTPEQRIENIIVTGSHYRFPFPSDNASLFNLTADEIKATPSLGSDPIRLVDRLPGSASVGVSAKPRIRGGLQDEVLITMDGVELLEPFHLADFHQGFSSIDSRVIQSLDVYTGGFPARYGNRMSGVIAINTDRPLPDYPHEIGLSTFSRFANTQGETRDPRPVRWMASVRQGDLDEITEFMEAPTGEPRYLDATGRIEWPIGQRTTLVLGNIIARDDNEFIDDEETAEAAGDNRYYWVKLDTAAGPDLHSSLVATWANLDRRKRERSFEEDGKAGFVNYRQEVGRFSLRNDNHLRQPGRIYEFGFELARAYSDYRFTAQYDRGELAELLGNRPVVQASFNRKPSGWSGGMYAAADLMLGDRWSVQPSLRWDWQNYYFGSSQQYFSPRLALAYDKSDDLRYWLSIGRFSQPQGINELPALDGETRFSEPQHADQVIAGVNWEQGAYRAKGELYYKRYRNPKKRFENLFNPFVLVPELEPDRVALLPDQAFARGVDLELRYDFNGALKGLVRFSYMDARDRIDGRWAPRRWSQKETVNAIVTWQKDGFSLSAALSWHSGWRSTFLPASIAADSDIAPASFLNNRELKNYMSLDIAASKAWQWGSTQITLYGDITNALERDNSAGADFEAEESDGEIHFVPEREILMPLIASVGIILAF